MTNKERLEQRAEKVQRLETLNGKDGAWTEAEAQEFDNLVTEIQLLDKQLNSDETLKAVKRLSQAGMPHNEKEADALKDYSFLKAFREASQNQQLTGLEAEMSQEAHRIAKEVGITDMKPFAIPMSVLATKAPYKGASPKKYRGDMDSTAATGGETIETELRSFIDILRARLTVLNLGATMFDDLTGNVSFPKMGEDASGLTENTETGAADEHTPSTSSVDLTPTRLQVFVEVTNQLLNQSSLSVESWLRSYLAYQIDKHIDSQSITHILNNVAAGNVVPLGTDGAAIDWASVVQMETEVAVDDALVDQVSYLTNPKVRGDLKTTEKASNTAQFLMGESQMLNGYRTAVSTQVPSNLTKGTGTDLSAMIFGNWADLYLGMWGGVDFLVNPYSKDTTGIVRINAGTFYDKALARDVSFSAIKDIVTSA